MYTHTHIYTAFSLYIYLCAIKCIHVLKCMDMYANKIYFEIPSFHNQNDVFKKTSNNKCWNVGRVNLLTVGWSANLCSHNGNKWVAVA